MDLLERLTDLERRPGARKYTDKEFNLDGFREWLAGQGSPQDRVPWVHVAGTKGKGSTAAMTESILRCAGLRTGLYTSPHLEHYGQRFRIDGAAMSREAFQAALARIELLVPNRLLPDYEDPTKYRTVFEILTAIAFREFASAGVEAGVLEVGLGGRLDSTNIVRPTVCVITPIGLDHTRILGNTVEEIAAEKAGIIKPGRPVVVFRPQSEAQEVARDVVVARARAVGAPVYSPVPTEIVERHATHQKVRASLPDREIEIDLALMGDFQADNLGLALRAALLFGEEEGFTFGNHSLMMGGRLVDWPGRLEAHAGSPPLILDGAHCPLSAAALGANLKHVASVAPPPYVLLWGMQADKNAAGFLENLVKAAPAGSLDHVVCYQVPGDRGAKSEDLAAIAREHKLKPVISRSITEAFARAQAMAKSDRPAGADKTILATGTIYTLATFGSLHAGSAKAPA